MLGRSFLVALAMALAACTQIPVSELTQYRDAFNQVEQTSESVLVEFDQTLKQSRTIVAIREKAVAEEGAEPVAPYPIEFEDFLKQLGPPDGQDIETRRRALRVVSQYNDMLTQLAEGKSVESIRTSAGGLVEGLGKFVVAASGTAVPGLSALVSLAETLAGQIERARLRAEFETAVQDGAPLIDAILQAFIDDASDHYKLRAGFAAEQRTLIVADSVDQVRALRDLLQSHAAPDDPIALQDQLNTVLLPLRGELRPFGFPYQVAGWPAGAAAFTSVEANQVQLLLKEAGRSAEAYGKNVQDIRARGEALAKYRQMLTTTKTALRQLRQALDRPQDLEVVAEEILTLAFGVKSDLARLRAAFAAAPAP
jgi:hypothetical protein